MARLAKASSPDRARAASRSCPAGCVEAAAAAGGSGGFCCIASTALAAAYMHHCAVWGALKHHVNACCKQL